MGDVVTIRDVARLAQVSVATVSRALNGQQNVAPGVRVRVLDAARELKYVPHHAARSLSSRKTRTIGLVLPDLHGEFFSELMALRKTFDTGTDLKLWVRVDAINLFNWHNWTDYNTDRGNPGFPNPLYGTQSGYNINGDPRTYKLSMGFDF